MSCCENILVDDRENYIFSFLFSFLNNGAMVAHEAGAE
jgi:hypothetical protein